MPAFSNRPSLGFLSPRAVWTCAAVVGMEGRMEDGLDTTRAAVEAHVDGAVLSGLIVDLAARMIVVECGWWWWWWWSQLVVVVAAATAIVTAPMPRQNYPTSSPQCQSNPKSLERERPQAQRPTS